MLLLKTPCLAVFFIYANLEYFNSFRSRIYFHSLIMRHDVAETLIGTLFRQFLHVYDCLIDLVTVLAVIHIFFRTPVLRKFDITFSYKHCNFSRNCLLVKMAGKTVTHKVFSSDTKHIKQNILAKRINRINRDLIKIILAKKELLNPVIKKSVNDNSIYRLGNPFLHTELRFHCGIFTK